MAKLYLIGLCLILSCCKPKFNVTEKWIESSDGISSGLSFALLTRVDSFNSNGVPINTKDSIRFDLLHNSSTIKKRIFFHKKNEGYFWRQFLTSRKFDTLPVDFEIGNWYAIWGGDLKSGWFSTNKHSFFLYCDTTDSLIVKEEVFQTNF